MAVAISKQSGAELERQRPPAFSVFEKIGVGGMAEVWKARSLQTQSLVAIKRVLPMFSSSERFMEMFAEEARIGRELVHPNIVRVLGFHEDSEGPFLELEWIDGLDLRSFTRECLTNGRITRWFDVAKIGVQFLRGLAAAHERRNAAGELAPVIHRDITPQNILVSRQGVAKIGDFGICRARDRVQYTDPGVIKGKVGYFAPELTYDAPPSIQTDLFAAGIVLWESLTGTRLFDAGSNVDTVLRVRECSVPHVSLLRADVPASFAYAIHRALHVRPSARFESARDMADAIEDALHGEKMELDRKSLRETMEDLLAEPLLVRSDEIRYTSDVIELNQVKAEPVLLTRKKDSK